MTISTPPFIIRSLKCLVGAMLIFFIILAFVFLIPGGIGLFHVNANLVAGTNLWIYGNITFGTFTALGVAILVFIALYNTEFG